MVNQDDLIVDIWDAEGEFTVSKKDEKKSLEDLIKELKKENSEEDWDWDRIHEIEFEIGKRLGLVSRAVFQEWQIKFAEDLSDELNSILGKIRGHRHDNSRNFSGKAEF